jgi:MFS family permease
MLLSFVLIGVAILGLAVIPSYAQIGIAAPILAVVARLVQGFALGGGVGPVSAFMLEAAPAGRRGLYSSLQYSSQGIAILAGGLVGTVLSNVLSDASLQAWGWRLAIGIGAIVLPFSFFLRRNLPDMLETPHAKEPKSNAGNLEIGSVRLVLLGFVMLTGSTITVYTLSFMTTYAQTTLRLPANVSFAASIMLGACTLLFCLISGWLSDRYGRKPVMIWPRAVLLIAVYPCFATLVAHPTAIALLTTTAIITTLNALSGTASFTAIAEGLPSRLRSGALGLVYALAISIFGGSAQPVLEGLIHGTGAMAPAWYLIAATAVALLAMLAMPESAPRISGRK